MLNKKSVAVLLLLIPLWTLAQREKVGVVLSGGGAAALSHVGVLKALEENNIPIDCITGTSMGAYIGALYASGYSPAEIDSMVRSPRFKQMARGKIPERFSYFFKEPKKNASLVTLKFYKDSLIQTSLPTNLINPLMMDLKLMERFAPPAAAANYDFDSLFVPFRCLASDVESKEKVVFQKGNLNKAVRASMSYPFYLRPIEVNGRLLFDGGLYNNFPLEVMENSFDADIIIGSNVSDNVPPPRQGDIISQVKNMLMDRTDYSKISTDHIIIEPDEQTSTFDFSNISTSIERGHQRTLARLDTIKEAIGTRTEKDSLKKARKAFQQGWPELEFNKVRIKGLNDIRSNYVRKVLNVQGLPLKMKTFRPKYFRVYSDNKIKSLFPTSHYSEAKGGYTLELDVDREKDIFVEFGGNVSSRPINMGYVGLQYNYLGKVSFSLGLNSYFGKFYGSVQAKGRFDFPTNPPVYLEPLITFNRWDYFKSTTAFFEDVRPSFLVQEERYAGVRAGTPTGTKGKLVFDGKLARIKNEYYQADNFSSTDTADQTKFDNWTIGASWERSTLNRKQYPTKGSFLAIRGRWVEGEERTIPGSTSKDKDSTFALHQWPQLKIRYQNYLKRTGHLHLGLSFEAVYSDQPFFDNYSGTILSAPAYQPIPESKTYFIHDLRAYKYIGGGLQNVFKITNNLDFRLEGYVFQPYRPIERKQNLEPSFGPILSSRNYIGSGAMVYHSPIGPVSLTLNYYDGKENPWSFLFNFGHLIFNDRPLN